MSEQGKPQAHDPGTMPFGAHDEADRQRRAAAKRKKEQDMIKARDAAIARLQRTEIGATKAQAEVLVDELGVEEIAKISDSEIKARIDESTAGGASALSWDPKDHKVDEVVDYARENPELVPVILDAERAGKARVTVIEELEKLSAPEVPSDGPGNPDGGDAGAEGQSSNGDDSGDDASGE